MRLGLWITSMAMFASGLMGCADARNNCGNKVLALWPSASGEYTFQEVILSTLNDPYSLSGGAAKIYFESMIGGNSFSGKVAQPRYTRSGDLCVPMDTASSMAVSMYAQFERIMQFENRNGTLDMLTWPRRVGLDINVRASDGMTHNNAFYLGQGDSIAVLPYNLDGVPLGLNPGIMAHEHFHAHFQRQVISVMNSHLAPAFDVDSLFYSSFAPQRASAKATVEDVDRADINTARGLNAFVLRAWNEGLADLYGAIFSGDPRFFDQSLPALKNARALTSKIAPFMSAFGLQFNARKISDPKNLVAISYDQGAYLARLMYALANSGVETPEKFLVRVMRRLKDIPPAILPEYESKVLEFEAVLPILLNDFPLNENSCATLRKSVSKEFMKKSFALCSAPLS
jgi:hypothetical protein